MPMPDATYTDRINRLAARPRDTNVENDPFIALMAHMAAVLANAADHGHVTTSVHRQLEALIFKCEVDMKARP